MYMKLHDNETLFTKAMLRGATCLLITAMTGVIPAFASSAEKTQELEVVQQNRVINGRVTDTKGEPVIGASVAVKGTVNGAITDLEGRFKLNVSAGDILVISYIGYETQEIPVEGSKMSPLMVVLHEDTQSLDEVVVIGYGTQRKGDVTSAVASVKAEDFTTGKIGDAAELIKGKVAGLTIAKGSGDPNAESTIRLRGVISLQGASTPLVLIDGIEGGLGTVAPET